MGTRTDRLDGWRSPWWTTTASLLLAALVGGNGSRLAADEPTPGESAPLARCDLQSLQVQSDEGMLGLGIATSAPTTEDTLSYRRTAAGDWIVPEKVNADEASFRGLLLTPAGPLLIEAMVTISDKPYRAVREQWIDAALSPAKRTLEAELADSEPTSSGPAESGPTDSEQAKAAAVAPEQSDTPPQRFVGQSPRHWLVEYVRLAESKVDRYEARWLLAQRAGGPALMELQRFSKSRSAQAPLVHFLDSDGNSQLDAEELSSAVERLDAADYNQDGSVDLRELTKATSGKSRFRPWNAQPLFAVVDDATDWGDLAYRWDVTQQSLLTLAESSPEVSLRIRLGAAADSQGVELLQISSPAFATDASNGVRSRAEVIAAQLTWGELEFSAGQAATADDASQISVGATIEGAPLWSVADSNQDNRLSARERAALLSLLADLDVDTDGTIVQAEIPSRIRWSVALGPAVHQILLKDTSRIPADPPETHTAPDWFVSMDVNHDGDLAAGEFLGTPEQFAKLDANGDNLISSAEASK